MAQQQQQQQVHPELQPLFNEFQEWQKEKEDLEGKKQQYLTQYNENAAVQKEFATLQEDSAVYKKIGVVLVKQDPDDAKNNVGRRLEMIQGQIKDVDAAISANEGKGEDIRKRILTKQRELQEKQAAANAAADAQNK
eukprot:INCI6994.3.p2 GENE.INCI6994.3~~INCI6994.3.p2  ORF type:complete len:137 (-),score=54.44 INCI6994.3:217-627(-)